MLFSRHHLLIFLLCLHQPPSWADSGERSHSKVALSKQHQVRRNYLNTSRFIVSSYAIWLEGSPGHVARLSEWLDEIAKIPYGRQTLEAILESGNELTIRHSEWALHANLDASSSKRPQQQRALPCSPPQAVAWRCGNLLEAFSLAQHLSELMLLF